MDTVTYKPIGIIHTPFPRPEGVPRQPAKGMGIEGEIEVFPEYAAGLADLDGFSHITLLFHLHLSRQFSLAVTPPLDDKPHGVFATRSPRRPNPIGLSVVRLIKIENATLYIRDLDIVDGTPLLDIKPFISDFVKPENFRIGWLTGKMGSEKK